MTDTPAESMCKIGVLYANSIALFAHEQGMTKEDARAFATNAITACNRSIAESMLIVKAALVDGEEYSHTTNPLTLALMQQVGDVQVESTGYVPTNEETN